MTRRLLVVCTANVCRSPTAERLLARRLDGLLDVDGDAWRVSSAGTGSMRVPVDPPTIVAADRVGIDLRDHARRTLDAELLADDGSDLVITMTREHLRHVIGLDPGAWPRTFTFKELVRRAETASGPEPAGFDSWRQALMTGRRAADLMKPSTLDDVADPYGGPQREHDAMVAELADLSDRLVAAGPWVRR